jgi:hypothetical protein
MSAALPSLTRRAFLSRVGCGALALQSLILSGSAASTQWKGVASPTHLIPKARRIIWLYMSGGPSHLETLDPKPQLARLHGQPMPQSFTRGQQVAQLQGQELRCLAPQFPFRCFGRSGAQFTELFPQIGNVADDLCIVKSMTTDAINHDPAHALMNTGSMISGRPSMGSWVLYGLGSESQNLPGYIVLTSTEGRSPQPLSQRFWHSGCLPGEFQGVPLRSRGDPVHYLTRPPGVTLGQQRDVVKSVQSLNQQLDAADPDPEIATRIAQYEMAFRMQSAVPELVDLSNEPKHVQELYGCRPGDGSFASNCLLARRLAERGVRFIQLYHRDWDHHNDLARFIRGNAASVDQATAALITDLKQRGLLDDTLVIWGGEFGRTPMSQTNKGGPGRDHHMKAFSMFFCGGGIRPGVTYGATDDLGYHVVENQVHVHDLHATLLHLLGIHHERLSVRFQGLNVRLTGVEGPRVVTEILA